MESEGREGPHYIGCSKKCGFTWGGRASYCVVSDRGVPQADFPFTGIPGIENRLKG